MNHQIHELPKDQFYKVRQVCARGDCLSVEPWSIIELNNPGWVFTDNPTYPVTALVWSQGIQGFYLPVWATVRSGTARWPASAVSPSGPMIRMYLA